MLKLSVPLLVLATCTFAACASKQDDAPSSVAAAAAAGTSTTSSASGQSGANLIAPSCEVPFTLEIPGLTPVTNESDLPGELRLTELKFHSLWENTNESFVVSAYERDAFAAHLDCNGTIDVSKNNSSVSSVDEDGTRNTHTQAFNRKLTASFNASILLGKASDKKRVLEAALENGKITKLESTLVPSSDGQTKMDAIPLDRIELGNDMFATVRLYVIDAHHVELRAKLELRRDENGKRTIIFARATYESAE